MFQNTIQKAKPYKTKDWHRRWRQSWPPLLSLHKLWGQHS